MDIIVSLIVNFVILLSIICLQVNFPDYRYIVSSKMTPKAALDEVEIPKINSSRRNSTNSVSSKRKMSTISKQGAYSLRYRSHRGSLRFSPEDFMKKSFYHSSFSLFSSLSDKEDQETNQYSSTIQRQFSQSKFSSWDNNWWKECSIGVALAMDGDAMLINVSVKSLSLCVRLEQVAMLVDSIIVPIFNDVIDILFEGVVPLPVILPGYMLLGVAVSGFEVLLLTEAENSVEDTLAIILSAGVAYSSDNGVDNAIVDVKNTRVFWLHHERNTEDVVNENDKSFSHVGFNENIASNDPNSQEISQGQASILSTRASATLELFELQQDDIRPKVFFFKLIFFFNIFIFFLSFFSFKVIIKVCLIFF